MACDNLVFIRRHITVILSKRLQFIDLIFTGQALKSIHGFYREYMINLNCKHEYVSPAADNDINH